MKPVVISERDRKESYTEERCFISEIINESNHDGFSIARARVAPGVTTALHALQGTTEVYYMLRGEGRMEVAGRELGKVEPGDTVTIPAGASQRIVNTGEEDLLFLCICSPRFRPEVYRDLESA